MCKEHSEPTQWRFTNALMRQAILAVGEVMGEHGLHVVLRQADLAHYVDQLPPDDLKLGATAAEYAALNQAVEEFYGRAGKGMLQRIGRASFRYGVEKQSAVMGLAGVALRAIPRRERVKFILNRLAKALMDVNEESCIEVKETPEGYLFANYGCSLCYGRQEEHAVCHLLVGSLSEAVQWATRKDYPVREVECRAMGADACRFLIATGEETP